MAAGNGGKRPLVADRRYSTRTTRPASSAGGPKKPAPKRPTRAKRARRPQRTGEDVSERPDLAGTSASAEDSSALDGLPDDLVTALRTLDEPTREAVVLHDVYHVPYHELAERAGVAVGTVKSRIHRGHARLAAVLRPAGEDGGEPSGPHRPPTRRR